MFSAIFSSVLTLPLYPLLILLVSLLAAVLRTLDECMFHSKPPPDTEARAYWDSHRAFEDYLGNENYEELESYERHLQELQARGAEGASGGAGGHHRGGGQHGGQQQQQQQQQQRPSSAADIGAQLKSMTQSAYFQNIVGGGVPQ